MASLQDLYDRRSKILISIDTVVEKGQTYSIEGVSLTRADLDTLHSLLNEIEREIANKEAQAAGRQAGVSFATWR